MPSFIVSDLESTYRWYFPGNDYSPLFLSFLVGFGCFSCRIYTSRYFVIRVGPKRTNLNKLSRDGAVVRALVSRQCGPGSISGLGVICGLSSVVVASRLCSEGFSPGSPVFLPPQNPTFPNSNSTWKQWKEEALH